MELKNSSHCVDNAGHEHRIIFVNSAISILAKYDSLFLFSHQNRLCMLVILMSSCLSTLYFEEQ